MKVTGNQSCMLRHLHHLAQPDPTPPPQNSRTDLTADQVGAYGKELDAASDKGTMAQLLPAAVRQNDVAVLVSGWNPPDQFAPPFGDLGIDPGDRAYPLRTTQSALAELGITHVDSVDVDGVGSTENNAQLIYTQILALLKKAQQTNPNAKLLLIGHSKGGLDIERMLADHPDLRASVDGVLDEQVPFGGTLDADSVDAVRNSPDNVAKFGPDAALHDLTSGVRAQWNTTGGRTAMQGTKVFSLATDAFGGSDGAVSPESTVPASGMVHHTVFKGPSHITLNQDDTPANRKMIETGLLDLFDR